METVEIVMFIVIALIAGSLVLMFVINYDWEKTYEDTNKLVNIDKELKYTVTKEQFIAEVYLYWQDCAFGETQTSYSVYVKDGKELSKAEILEHIQKINKENELNYQVLSMKSIMLPKVLTLKCAGGILFIE
jgi:hypothetical protein